MFDCFLTIVYKMFQKRCLMKNITLLSALLLTLGSVSAQAQMTVRRAPHSTSPLETLKAKVARSMGKLSFKDIKMVKDQRSAAVRLGIMARQRRVAQEEENHHQYKPQHQIEYVVNDDTGEYEKSVEYTFTYAPNGEVATQLTDNGTTIVKSEYTYDGNFNVTCLLNSESTDHGVTYTPSEKRDQVFDPIVEDLVIEKNRYEWNGSDWGETGDAYKRTITRDADNNVTSAVISVPYNGQYEDTKRVTNTFDPVTKLCDTYKFEELGYNDEGTDLVWSESDALKDIKWNETNGQLVSDYSDWINYDNVISSATFVYHEDGDEVTGGYITVDYDPEGYYQEVIDYSVAFPGKEMTTITVDNDKGESVYEHKYYKGSEEGVELTEDDLQEHEKSIYRYDENDNLVFEANYMLNEEGTELEQVDGTRYDYTYDSETGAEKELVVSTYDYDSGKYMPMMKIVTDAYTDLTAGIHGVKNEVKSAPVEVYTLQGIRTNSTDSKGVYIIRQGNVVKKVVR